ncbi:MAG: hypothetical protein M1816_000477 [Peltula sp. TS41687]|nr:MAG: hypothetical protein M1816_000477 [Peltula sp. TS41687]
MARSEAVSEYPWTFMTELHECMHEHSGQYNWVPSYMADIVIDDFRLFAKVTPGYHERLTELVNRCFGTAVENTESIAAQIKEQGIQGTWYPKPWKPWETGPNQNPGQSQTDDNTGQTQADDNTSQSRTDAGGFHAFTNGVKNAAKNAFDNLNSIVGAAETVQQRPAPSSPLLTGPQGALSGAKLGPVAP